MMKLKEMEKEVFVLAMDAVLSMIQTGKYFGRRMKYIVLKGTFLGKRR